MKRKKILILFPRFGIGGISKALSFVANVCDDAGYNVICTAMSLEDETINLHPSIPRFYINYNPSGSIIHSTWMKMDFLWKLRRHFHKIKPDLVVAFGVDHVRIALLASLGMHIKVLGSERGDPSQYSRAQKKKYTGALKHAAGVVFQTEMARSLYDNEIQRKSVIIPNPAVPRHQTVLPFYGERDHSILSCGRLSKEKNFAGLIRAFGNILEEAPDYNLKIYGEGPEKEKLQKLAKQLGLEKNVLFMGNRPDVFKDEHNCGMFVLNSLTEGMPNALIEAMIAGIPCIATDCPSGGVRFLADEGRRVRLVPVMDDLELSKAMLQIISDRELSKSLSEKSREILTVLDPLIIGKQWENLIEDILRAD